MVLFHAESCSHYGRHMWAKSKRKQKIKSFISHWGTGSLKFSDWIQKGPQKLNCNYDFLVSAMYMYLSLRVWELNFYIKQVPCPHADTSLGHNLAARFARLDWDQMFAASQIMNYTVSSASNPPCKTQSWLRILPLSW